MDKRPRDEVGEIVSEPAASATQTGNADRGDENQGGPDFDLKSNGEEEKKQYSDIELPQELMRSQSPDKLKDGGKMTRKKTRVQNAGG